MVHSIIFLCHIVEAQLHDSFIHSVELFNWAMMFRWQLRPPQMSPMEDRVSGQSGHKKNVLDVMVLNILDFKH